MTPFDAAPATAALTATLTSAHVKIDCLVCPVRTCIGRLGLREENGAWCAILAPRRAIMPGAPPLFVAGTRVLALYSVRAGCIKTYTIDAQGNEHIRGFHLPGDLIGLDALGSERFRSTATAVEPSQVCVAPLAELRRVVASQPELAEHLIEQASRELALALALSGNFSAEQRLAAFLLNMEQRLLARDGLLRLPMPRRDIGAYLRLAPETVCRTLKGFALRKWVRGEGRDLRLLARDALQKAAEPVVIDAPRAAFDLAA